MYPLLSFIIYNFKKLENFSEIKLYDQIFSELTTHTIEIYSYFLRKNAIL